VVGAGGGVNTAAIQIAKLAGCRVFVVGSDARKLALAASLGADVLIDRSQVDWGRQVYQLTHKRGVDVVVDNVGGAALMTSLRSARRGGRILTVGNTAGPKVEFDNRFMFAKHLSLIGSTMSTRAEFATVMGLVFAGRLRPVIDSSFPLADIRAGRRVGQDHAVDLSRGFFRNPRLPAQQRGPGADRRSPCYASPTFRNPPGPVGVVYRGFQCARLGERGSALYCPEQLAAQPHAGRAHHQRCVLGGGFLPAGLGLVAAEAMGALGHPGRRDVVPRPRLDRAVGLRSIGLRSDDGLVLCRPGCGDSGVCLA
jgi:hypothetical protein